MPLVLFSYYSKSASCTHVSAVLHALVAMTSKQLHTLSLPSIPALGDEETGLPVTSTLCQWKIPKKRKESTLEMSKAVFEKHDYEKPKKRRVSLTEDFDPRPVEYRGTAQTLLKNFLDDVRGESLGVSVMFDPHYCYSKDPVPSPELPSTTELKQRIVSFKESLIMSPAKIREIEQNTRAQRNSCLWFSCRRYRITASRFGDILRRRTDTRPDSLVLNILQPRFFSTAATKWGIQNEPVAIQRYITYQCEQGRDVTVGPSGFLVCETHPFLGATPDGTVYDPTDKGHPFGFIEVKCPYSQRNCTPLDACLTSGFFCKLQTQPDGSQIAKVKINHPYYAQVQGQMAVGQRPWCDFVVFTSIGLSVERVSFNEEYWQNTLLPALETFYDNCLAPEIVSPVHALGMSIRDLTKDK